MRGQLISLEPLTVAHVGDLFASFAEDRSVWRWLPVRPPSTEDDLGAAVAAALQWQRAGGVVCFAQIDTAAGRAVGMTNYLDIAVADDGLEIGGTWLGRSAQRTGKNREAKYLLLRHAFEELGASRVQLRTDARNEQSQTAIARLGATREGILRCHKRCWDGFLPAPLEREREETLALR